MAKTCAVVFVLFVSLANALRTSQEDLAQPTHTDEATKKAAAGDLTAGAYIEDYDIGVVEAGATMPVEVNTDCDCLSGAQFLVLVEPRDAAMIAETVHAFGGKQVRDVEFATHVIVPNGASSADLGSALLERALSDGKFVVRVAWLEEAVRTCKSAFNQELLDAHVPSTLSDLKDLGRGPRTTPVPFDLSLVESSEEEEEHFSVWDYSRRRKDSKHLQGSLKETHDFLKKESPEEIEAGHIQMALERSLLDCALTINSARRNTAMEFESPEAVLGVSLHATVEEVRAAYREKVKTAHPDKGGNNATFCRLQQAYLAMTGRFVAAAATTHPKSLASPGIEGTQDFQLREHRSLVESWFASHGEDISLFQEKQERALHCLNLKVCDLGATNKNEKGERIFNQCFYLSLARSYLGVAASDRSFLEETALKFKRILEAAVLAAHPDWGGERVGDDVQAFSDFLFYILDSHGLLAELCVAIFDSVSGSVEIYKAKDYPGPERALEQRANLLLLKYIPGHYQALVPDTSDGGYELKPSLPKLKQCLDDHEVFYVVTEV